MFIVLLFRLSQFHKYHYFIFKNPRIFIFLFFIFYLLACFTHFFNKMTRFKETGWDQLSIKRRRSISSLATSVKEPPVHFHALRISEDQLNTIKNKAVKDFYVVKKYIYIEHDYLQKVNSRGVLRSFF